MALEAEGIVYTGILYGQFMLTNDGPKLVETNARFGDPEAINVLPLLQTSLIEICNAIMKGPLEEVDVRFDQKATVCKYVVPSGYGGIEPRQGSPLKVNEEEIEKIGAKVFFAKVSEDGDHVRTTTSRALAVLGITDSVRQAEEMAEAALHYVEGDYDVRRDIGKARPKPSVGADKPLAFARQ